MRRLRLALAAFALALTTATTPADACLWDSDTLRAEAADLPEVANVAVGRFERNPPLYYEVRLAHAERAIAGNPGALAEYDDAGVSCDRLGRGADAIRWMELKRARLAAFPGTADDAYRLHANLGTLLAHDWIRRGADRGDTSALRRGRDEIAEAIRINPSAHFGRERVQLALMEWMLAPTAPLPPARLGTDPLTGLAGIIAFGGGWESGDVFGVLGTEVEAQGKAVLALVVNDRTAELRSLGRRSLFPEYRDAFERSGPKFPYGFAVEGGRKAAIHAWFKTARIAADAWNREREAYMLPRLTAGRHPDWDDHFWDEFTPSDAAKAVAPPFELGREAMNFAIMGALGGGVLVALVVVVGGIAGGAIVLLRRTRARRRAASASGSTAG